MKALNRKISKCGCCCRGPAGCSLLPACQACKKVMDALRKALFKSPYGEDMPKECSSAMETLLNKNQVEIEVENNLNIVEKESHDRRIAKMNEELKNLANNDWMFNKVEDYVSF